MKKELHDHKLYDPSKGLQAAYIAKYYNKKQSIPFNIHIFEEIENVNYEALHKAFCFLLERHEIFRTSLLSLDGKVKMKVHPFDESLVNIHVFDLKKSRGKAKKFLEIRRDSWFKEFAFDQTPWILIKLVYFDEKKSYLKITMPHNIAEAHSINIIRTELLKSYKSYLSGDIVSLPEVFQYKDYIAEIKELLLSSKGEELKLFWQNRLSDLPENDLTNHFSYKKQDRVDSYKEQIRKEILECYGKTSSEMESRHFGNFSFLKFPAAVSYDFYINFKRLEILRNIAKETNVILPAVIMATFKLLIYKLTGEADVVIGTNMSLRDNAKKNKVIGFLVNTVLIRSAFEDTISLNEFIKKIDSELNLISDYSIIPFEEVLYNSDISFQKISKVFMNIINEESIVLPVKRLKPKHSKESVMQYFDIDCHVTTFRNVATVKLNYKTELFKKSAIELIARKYLDMIDGLEMTTTKKIMDL